MSAIRRLMTVLVLSVLLAGCQEDTSDTGAGAAASDLPVALAPQRAACEKDGGRWGSVPGRDAFACYRITRDANKTCETERDCEGLCLARSRTCSPQTPFFGCHEVLSSSGVRQTLCIE